MTKILFVCLGNICRSPLAEGIFRDLVTKKGLSEEIMCDSAGTAGYHIGQLPDQRAIAIASEHGITLTHRGRKLTEEDLDIFDHIIVMDDENFKFVHNFYHLTKEHPPSVEKLFLLADFDPLRPANEPSEIPDPYYGDKNDFERVFEQIQRSCQAYFKVLIKEEHLSTN